MTDWNASPRNTGMICSFSPQISDSNAEPLAVKRHTTVQSRPAKRSVSPTPVWSKRPAIFSPTQISDFPDSGRRPATTWMLERTDQTAGLTPRTTTLASPVVSYPFLGSGMTT